MKALALLSGGLDSTLAIKVILDQDIEVEAVNFFTPFCQCSRKNGCGHQARKIADKLAVKLKLFNIGNEYLEIVANPKYGYGKNLNPCIDCRILMHKKAKVYMQEIGAAFIITGEVLGQRPMSQLRPALGIIERDSGLQRLIVRPLSAQLLPATIPEESGYIKREKLLQISGRSRKIQMALAKSYKINDYLCPAGGCLLTDHRFAQRLQDLMTYAELNLSNVELLKVGRHFRLSSYAKLIVGRDEQENARLLKLTKENDICLSPQSIKGPLGIARGAFDPTLLNLAAQIIARYSDGAADQSVKVAVENFLQQKINLLEVNRMSNEQLSCLRI